MSGGLLFLILHGPPQLLRVTYDVDIFYEGDHWIVQMALNQLTPEHFSLHCRKSLGGSLFTFWATPEENLLYFPKARLVFSGRAEQRFGLFPGGPELARAEWLQLLGDTPPEGLPDFQYQKVDDWRMLFHRNRNFVIRWREKKRAYSAKYRAKVLVPEIAAEARREPFSEFNQYGSADADRKLFREN